MVELTVNIGRHKAGSIKLNRFTAELPHQLKRGLVTAGAMVQRRAARKLSGPAHSTGEGTGNPYPGVVSGNLRKIESIYEAAGPRVTIGPGTQAAKYAAAQEFGATIPVTPRMRRFLHAKGIHLRASTGVVRIPPRPYMGDTWRELGKRVIKVIMDAVTRPLDR